MSTRRASRFAKGAGLVAAGAIGALALSGIALADDPAESGDDTGQRGEQPLGEHGPRHGGPGGPGGPGAHGGPGGGPMLHGEGTVKTPEGDYRSIQVQTGSIDDVTDSSITITSEDGYQASYTIDADTDIHVDGQEAASAELAAGMSVRLLADADTGTAVRIGALTEEGKAEMEQRRAEREERRQEFRDNAAERVDELQEGVGQLQQRMGWDDSSAT